MKLNCVFFGDEDRKYFYRSMYLEDYYPLRGRVKLWPSLKMSRFRELFAQRVRFC